MRGDPDGTRADLTETTSSRGHAAATLAAGGGAGSIGCLPVLSHRLAAQADVPRNAGARPAGRGQTLASALVASFGKISACGGMRRMCQNPRPDRIRNSAAAAKATIAATSMICPACHHP